MSDRLADAERLTRAWMEGAVIGMNLCPFAAGPWAAGRVRLAVHAVEGFEASVTTVADEVRRLVDTREDRLSSTLVVFPSALKDFDTFLDAIAVIEDMLAAAGADGLVQLAHFHPDYRFEGVAADDVTHFTNRSPFPTVHLLRTHEVEQALEAHGDGLAIPEANMALLRRLGAMEVERRWREFLAPEGGEA